MRGDRARVAGMLERELAAARREGYLAGLAAAETALYSGMDALVQLLRSVDAEGEPGVDRGAAGVAPPDRAG